MAKKSVSPIMTWGFWSIGVLGVFLAATWEYFLAGFSADSSYITWIIVLFFILGLGASLRAALYLEKEFNSLKAMDTNQRVIDANASDVAALFDAALERIRRGERLEMRNLISAYAARMRARTDNIGVIANMLVTIGLLGTVLGLIITVTGLDKVLQAGSSDFAAMKAGMTVTVSGMGTAFYTTLFGALLGGVVLKVLGAEMKKSSTILAADALRFSELHVSPLMTRNASEALAGLEQGIGTVQLRLKDLAESIGAVIGTIDAKQTTLASGLDGLAKAVVEAADQSRQRADEHLAGFVDSIAKVIDASTTDAQRRLDAQAARISGKLGEAAAALAELSGSGKGE